MLNKPWHDFVMFQSCDPQEYFEMLSSTSKINNLYCKNMNILYNSFCGYLRGFHSWHAAFNRIVYANYLLDAQFRGWLIYLDADAYVYDLSFDITKYLVGNNKNSFIFTRGSDSGHNWDVNDGVFFCNYSHEDTRILIKKWMNSFERTSIADLRKARNWYDVPSDQQMLQEILKENDDLTHNILYESHDFMNSRRARFLKQILRSTATDMAGRIEIIDRDIAYSLNKYSEIQK